MNREILIAVALAAPAGLAPAASAGVIITEIMYNPAGTDANQEYLEIYNAGDEPVDIGGWYVADEDGQSPPVPAGAVLRPGEAAVFFVREDTVDLFRAAWGLDASVQIFSLAGVSLANAPTESNEIPGVYDASGVAVDIANYQDGTNGWPAALNGPSLYLLNIAYSPELNDNGAAWTASVAGVDGARASDASVDGFSAAVGSPGYVEPAPTSFPDCNGNGVDDAIDIIEGASSDCDGNGVPDECELAAGDCDGDGLLDACEIRADWTLDRNNNGVLDACDIASGASLDANGNGIPDEAENRPDIVITEIMYNPRTPDATGEYVEIYNAGPVAVDLSGWSLEDLEDENGSAFPQGFVLRPGEVAVLIPGVSETAAEDFRAAWGVPAGVQIVAMEEFGSRANSAGPTNEILAIVDAAGVPVDVANYEVPELDAEARPTSDWPFTDGNSSIFLLAGRLSRPANDIGSNWAKSIAGLNGAVLSHGGVEVESSPFSGRDEGSPGVLPPAAFERPTGEVIITELMHTPRGAHMEYAEILNVSGRAVDISGWHLRDEDGRTFGVPAGSVLPPNGVAVLAGDANGTLDRLAFENAWCRGYDLYVLGNFRDRAEGAPYTGLGGLSNTPSRSNEFLTLRAADGTVVDIVDYDDDGFVWPPPASASVSPYSIYVLPGAYDADANDDGLNWFDSFLGFDAARRSQPTAALAEVHVGSPGVVAGINDALTLDCSIVAGCQADFDGDGAADVNDLLGFLGAFRGQSAGADFDGDGAVDVNDLLGFLGAFRRGC